MSEMWFCVTLYHDIIEVKVEKETDKFLVINEPGYQYSTRVAKESDWRAFFKTRAECLRWHVARLEEKIRATTQTIAYAEEQLSSYRNTLASVTSKLKEEEAKNGN